MSILLYSCTTWTLTIKSLEKKLDRNYTWILYAVLNKSWKQHPTKPYGHLLPILKNTKRRQTSFAGHCWWSRQTHNQRTSKHGHTSIGWPAKIYIHQLCVDTGYHLEDLPIGMNGKRGIKGIHAVSMPWWWSKSIETESVHYFSAKFK